MPTRPSETAEEVAFDAITLLLNPPLPAYSDHRCGRCNNGTGVRNPECPNRPKETTHV